MRKSIAVFLLAAVSASHLCATQAFAGPLAMDTTAMAGFHGSTPYQEFDLFNHPTGLIGTVDYAVWAPGTFPGAFAGFSASDYVYAYQVHETGPSNLAQVAIVLGGPADQFNIGNFTGNNGFGLVSGDASDPNLTFIIPFDSANWVFDGVGQGGTTDGLAFSSRNAPFSYYGVTATDDTNIVAFVIPLPSPRPDTPEPGTLILALCGAALVAVGRLRTWRRRR